MTKWWKEEEVAFSGTNLEPADPAADPEVQADVLKAYFKSFNAWPQNQTLVDNVRSGNLTLQVEEERT